MSILSMLSLARICWKDELGSNLALERYCFNSKLYCGRQSSFCCPAPTCKAYPIAILLHAHCAIYPLPFICHTP